MTESLSEYQRAARPYIEERSIPVTETGCWMWLMSLGSHGYGTARILGDLGPAHRISYAAFHGPIPPGMLVQHSCDNKWCVAPEHLSLGTDATNAMDKSLKGRAAKKLTHRDVLEIRRRLSNGDKQRHVARDFGVNQRAVLAIYHRRVWAHVAAEPGVTTPSVVIKPIPAQCLHGHDLTGPALRVSATGIYSCRECHKAAKRRHRIKKAMGVAS